MPFPTRHAVHRARNLALAISLGVAGISHAMPPASEPTQLALLMRQVDAADRLARDADRPRQAGLSRYHFDYARLQADLQRVRAGIQDYLSPRRAQPRDMAVLWGAYTTRDDGAAAETVR